MTEVIHKLRRTLTVEEADTVIGTYPADTGRVFMPTVASPRAAGDVVRLVDPEQGDRTVGLITKLPKTLLDPLRREVLNLKYGQNVARHRMRNVGATFGYAPRKPLARQEGCRMTMTGRDHPAAEAILEATADYLAGEFERLLPEQSRHDAGVIEETVLDEWRIGARSLWTSGVINQMNVLPYHRDRNNLQMWSAMPTLRYGMGGGHLHLPEYELVLPCGDGDVSWFYGRNTVHGNTPLTRRKVGGYRYSIVYYALKGMKDCATYAEETAQARRRRTERERAEAVKLRGAGQ